MWSGNGKSQITNVFSPIHQFVGSHSLIDDDYEEEDEEEEEEEDDRSFDESHSHEDSTDSNDYDSASRSQSQSQSLHLNSKDTTGTVEEIAECVKDVLNQTIMSENSCLMLPMSEYYSNQPKIEASAESASKLKNFIYDTNVTDEIEECVADINNQTMAPEIYMRCTTNIVRKTKSSPDHHNSRNQNQTNVTAEIEECVADIQDQSYISKHGMRRRRSNHNNDTSLHHTTNVTAEIQECVADIHNQTMISNKSQRMETPGKQYHNTSNNITNVTAEIQECVADIHNQTMVADYGLSMEYYSPPRGKNSNGIGNHSIQDIQPQQSIPLEYDKMSNVTNITAEIAECVTDINNQSMAIDAYVKRRIDVDDDDDASA